MIVDSSAYCFRMSERERLEALKHSWREQCRFILRSLDSYFKCSSDSSWRRVFSTVMRKIEIRSAFSVPNWCGFRAQGIESHDAGVPHVPRLYSYTAAHFPGETWLSVLAYKVTVFNLPVSKLPLMHSQSIRKAGDIKRLFGIYHISDLDLKMRHPDLTHAQILALAVILMLSRVSKESLRSEIESRKHC